MKFDISNKFVKSFICMGLNIPGAYERREHTKFILLEYIRT